MSEENRSGQYKGGIVRVWKIECPSRKYDWKYTGSYREIATKGIKHQLLEHGIIGWFRSLRSETDND